MDRSRAALSLLRALALLAPFPAAGQAPRAGEPEEVFGETIEVRVVNLEVVVVDGEGRRVSGLAPSELKLKVDGKPVPIDYFTEVVEGKAVTAATGTGGAAGAPPPVGGIAPGGAVGTSYLVFVDDSFTGVAGNRNVVLSGLLEELSSLRPEDRIAVVSFDGSKPALLSGWSQSRTETRAVLERAMQQPGRGLAATRGVANLQAAEELGEIAEAPPGTQGMAPPPPIDVAEKGADDSCLVVKNFESRLIRASSALTATLRSLSGVPGRKVALVASGGWPHSAKEWALGTDYNRFPSGCKILGPKVWDPVHEVANQVGFTLYLVPIPDPESQEQSSQIQDTLKNLARQTGGEAWAGGARGHLLARAAEDTRSYYWLGFTPTWKGDDRGHQVDVEVTRPGLQVRNRRGFQDLSRRTEVSHMVESALLFGDPPGVLPLRAQFGKAPAGKGRKGMVRLPLRLAIPMDQVTMVQRGPQYMGKLELRIALLDAQGNRSDIPVIPVELSGPRPQIGQHAIYETQVELRPGRQEVVVALFDPPSGKLMKASLVVTP